MPQKKLQNVIEKLSSAILNCCYAFDNAKSAEKMFDFNCIGEDNIAWKEGPFISAPANAKQIDHTHPYCLRCSTEFSIAIGVVNKYIPSNIKKNGGKEITLPKPNENNSRVESIISKLTIIEQFEIYKEFAISLYGHEFGPYNEKKAKKMKQYFNDKYYDLLITLINRRNELTHENDCQQATMQEAVVYSSIILELVNIIYNIKQNDYLEI